MTNEKRRLFLSLPFNLVHGVLGRRESANGISLDDLRELSVFLDKLQPVLDFWTGHKIRQTSLVPWAGLEPARA